MLFAVLSGDGRWTQKLVTGQKSLLCYLKHSDSKCEVVYMSHVSVNFNLYARHMEPCLVLAIVVLGLSFTANETSSKRQTGSEGFDARQHSLLDLR